MKYWIWKGSVVYRDGPDSFERWDAASRSWVDAWDEYGLVVDGDMDLDEVSEGKALLMTGIVVTKSVEDQPRDEQGRWTDESGDLSADSISAASSAPINLPAFHYQGGDTYGSYENGIWHPGSETWAYNPRATDDVITRDLVPNLPDPVQNYWTERLTLRTEYEDLRRDASGLAADRIEDEDRSSYGPSRSERAAQAAIKAIEDRMLSLSAAHPEEAKALTASIKAYRVRYNAAVVEQKAWLAKDPATRGKPPW